MDSKRAFAVGVRVVGLVVCLGAMPYLVGGVIVLFDPNYRPNLSPAWHYLVIGVVGLLVGLYLLRGAPHVVRFAYRGEDEKPVPNRDDGFQ